jgi:GntR family transcriptional regulator/MocR family aminotransferase
LERMTKPSASRRAAREALSADLLVNDGDRLVHEKVYRRIRHLILSGAVAYGDRLPSSRLLAENLRISRNSILTAIDRLVADGWLKSRRGSGVYVSYSGRRIAAASWSHGAESPRGTIPFALGWASDIFPVQVWNRLQSRRWRTSPEAILRQQDRNGVPALREAIAAHVTLVRGLECLPSQIFVTTCIPSAVELAVQALGLIGSEFWVENPGCRSTLNALTRAEIRGVPIPVDERGMDIENGISSAPDAAGVLVTPARQAPTGVMLDGARRNRLAQWARSAKAWIFEDDFNWNGDGSSPVIPPYAAQDRIRTIYFNSFNNILFPGLRVAYLVAPTELTDIFAGVRGSEGDVNTANQLILADFIEEGRLDTHMKHLNACNAERRAALLDCVDRQLSKFLVPKHSAGGYFICGLDNFSEIDLLSAADAHNIAVTGMSEFELVSSGCEEVVLGFSQFQPRCLAKATSELRSVLNSLYQRDRGEFSGR